jgi:hypothetical protein
MESSIEKLKNEIKQAECTPNLLQDEVIRTWRASRQATENKILEILDQAQANIGSFSDGYHTFDELYEFRKMYNAVLFNEWGKQVISMEKEWVKDENGKLKTKVTIVELKYDVHKSKKHHDGELCFGGGWFIVVAVLPTGQISNHYKMEDWDLFQIPETETAKYEFDGHTPTDVLTRLKAL